MFKRLKKNYLKQKLSVKINLIYIAAVTIVTMAICSFLFVRASGIIEQGKRQALTGLLNQSSQNMDYIYGRVEDTCLRLYTTVSLKSVFLKNPEDYPHEQQIADYFTLTDIYGSNMSNRYVDGISMFFDNKAFYIDVMAAGFSLDTAKSLQWYESVPEDGRILWTYYSDPRQKNDRNRFTISCMRAFSDSEKIVGIIEVKLNQKYLTENLQQIKDQVGGEVYILSREGIVLSSSNGTKKGDKFAYSDMIELSGSQGSGEVPVGIGHAKYRMFYTTNDYGSIIAAVVPESVFMADITEFLYYAVLFIVIVLVVSFVLVNLFSQSITNRITRLSDFMLKVSLDSDKLAEISNESDEITNLENSSNKMISTSRKLMNDLRTAEEEKRRSDFQLLQAQINPHFLYNILDSINWMAYRNQNEKVSRMTKLLASFFRQSLNHGESIVTIEHEIKHVEVYLEILKLRYGESIDYIIDVDEEILPQNTINMILQPIVENAVTHGILEKTEQCGTVCITGSVIDGKVLLSVSDDGVGMDEDVRQRIENNEFPSSAKNGFGLKNVDNRIKLYYGSEYGISIDTSGAGGTTIEILLPYTDYYHPEEKDPKISLA